MSRGSVADVLMIIGVLVMLIGGWQYAAADGASTTSITNESTTVQSGETYQLAADGVRYQNLTVTANNTSYDAGEEFKIHQWTGVLSWTNQSEDGAEASISYEVKQQDQTTSGLMALLSPLRELWPYLLFLVISAFAYTTIDSTWGT